MESIDAVRWPLEDWSLDLADRGSTHVPPHVREALPIPSSVPGTVHLDLLAARLIPDPYLDRNELRSDWIGRVEWVIHRDVQIPPEWFTAEGGLVDGTDVTLQFDGVDTIATIRVNDIEVAQTQNMHRRYDVPLAGALRPGRNHIAVQLHSAWQYAEAYRDRTPPMPNAYPAPFNFIRKNASNFGWDWGPTLVTAGLWRQVRLVRSVCGRLTSVRPQTRLEGSGGRVIVDVDLDRHVVDGDARLVASVAGVTAVQEVTSGSSRLVLDVPDPDLWWPRDLGGQPLYDLDVSLEENGRPVDRWSARVGFRSLRLLTEEDEAGSEFAFEINGVVIPVRGANWIPDDCFLPRVDERRLAERLDQAVDANLNLLRVWGGGVYESREFYEACDERGLLVWQDFLFACAAYPEDEPLRGQVRAEARDNVERLMSHPSLVLWNGNNENIWGWHDWGWQEVLDGRPWGERYYLHDLPEIVAAVDPTRPYWPGSPYSGEGVHPNDPAHGCTHEWGVWNKKEWRHYADAAPRFVSEFGWQGPPTWSTITRSISDDPLTPESVGMLHHQKAEDGNGKLSRGLEPHLPVPQDMVDWHYAMQLNQAHAIRFAIEHYRSLRPDNTGVVIWQLNDCWPVTSWAAIDGYGRKRPLWYAMRDAFAPRLLTTTMVEGDLQVVAVNDGGDTWREEVTIARLDFDGNVLATQTLRLPVDRLSAARALIDERVARPGDPSNELLHLSTPSGVEATHFFAVDKELRLAAPDVRTEVAIDGAEVVLTVRAQSVVKDLCVFADRVVPAAEADQMMLTLLPGRTYEIRVHGVPAERALELVEAPVLRSLNELVVGSAGE